MFKSRDVIFEEGTTHLARQPAPTIFTDESNPFPYKPKPLQPTEIEEDRTIKADQLGKLLTTSVQGIAPRPLTTSELHKDNTKSLDSGYDHSSAPVE